MSQASAARRPFAGLITLAVIAFVAWEAFEFTINRVYVEVGQSLLLQYKGPILFGSRNAPKDGRLADMTKGEVGVIEQMPGPGRHFYGPLWWERTIVKDEIVLPGEVAIVTSLVGKDLSSRTPAAGEGGAGNGSNDQFLVDGDLGKSEYKGVLRKVYGPGQYRVNPYAFKFNKIKTDIEKNGTQAKYSGWVEINTGFVGVVTNQTDNPITGARKGIQPYVLPPGLYPMNPREQKVDIVETGYREKTCINPIKQDAQANPQLDTS